MGGTSTVSGSGGPPRPIATTTMRRERARRRATWPVTAVFPTRLPVPITASVATSTGAIGGGVNRKSGPSYGIPSARTLLASAIRPGGVEHGLVGEVEHDVGLVPCKGLVERGLEQHSVAVDVVAELLRAADEHGRDDRVLDLLERGADDGRVVLAVDDHDGTPSSGHPRVVTSRSIRPVYFWYSKVSVENWMIRSSPWNGWRREIETWWPLISITL